MGEKNEMLPMKNKVIIIGKQNRILCPLKGILKKQKLTYDTKSTINLKNG